ncbi:MAG: S41 family peptidase [Terracidiphilus sp.]|jgi:carboxyl-terminal processing protease
MRRTREVFTAAGLLICVLFTLAVCRGQQPTTLSKNEQAQVTGMLRDAYSDVKKYYYDPTLQGLDWDARYRQYSARIGTAHNMGDGFRIVAAFLSGLKDSHTYFAPPMRTTLIDPGYRFALIGDACFITHVRPKTDAEEKLRVGDEVVKLNGFNVNRSDYHDVRYFFNILAPPMAEQLDLQSPTGEQRQAVVNALVKPGKAVMDLTQGADYYDLVRRSEDEDHVTRSQIIERGDVAIWRLPQFNLDTSDVERFIGISRKHKTLILDLRGNSGGAVDTLKSMVGFLFDHDVKIGDRVGKKDKKPMLAKHFDDAFSGKLIVLVDAGSASASELLARVVQLEHRGTVIGDKTAGAVMEAKYYRESQGVDTRIFYGFSVTDANLIMSDGQSLEKVGVVPDELLLPTGADLAAGRDPVLAHAAELGGVKLDPAEAGKLFPFEWLPL